jgi:hypothetical protein
MHSAATISRLEELSTNGEVTWPRQFALALKSLQPALHHVYLHGMGQWDL